MSEKRTKDQESATKPQEEGRVQLDKPLNLDVETIQQSYFPDGRYLQITNGDAYILDRNDRTILLFADKFQGRFHSIYSPLQPLELKSTLTQLPQDISERLISAFNLQDVDTSHASPTHSRKNTFASELLAVITQNYTTTNARAIEASYILPERKPTDDLPEDHFLDLSDEEYEARRKAHWGQVKDLDDNDPKKIVYFRRFTSEFKSSVGFNPELTTQSSEPYRYYAVDTSKLNELPKVEPYRTKVEIPQGKKVGIVVGYHHLEKPWGHILKTAFEKQVDFNPNQIQFIVIENMDIPTGEQSPRSNIEIEQAVQQRGITHVIDAHEQLATLNHYMASHFDPVFRQALESSAKGEYTLDPFIPTWMIEQYYEGHMYPQQQHAINEQIRLIEELISTI